MEREISVKLTGDASDLRRASREAEQALEGMRDKGSSVAGDLVNELGRIAGAAALATAAFSAFKAGISANAEMESLRLGIATIVSANQAITDQQGRQIEGARKLEVAQAQVAEVFAKLQQDAINTTATMPQLAAAFQSALSSALPLGISLDDTRKMTVNLVQAMGALQIPLDQANQEINSILQAQISEDSMLGKKLKIKNEEVKLWQEQGTLVENILKKTEAFAVAGAQAGQTWSGATSTLADNLGRISQIATGDAFKTLTDKLNEVNAKAFGDEAQENARLWGVIINDSLEGALMGAEAVGEVLIFGADKLLGMMHGVKGWASQLGAEQYRAESVNDLVKQIPTWYPGQNDSLKGQGITMFGKTLLGLTPADTPTDLLVKIAETNGLKGKSLEGFRTSLAAIDKNAAAGAAGQANEGEEALKDLRKRTAERKAMLAGLNIKGNGTAGAEVLTGFKRAELEHDRGLMGDSEYRSALAAHIKTLKAGTEEEIKRRGELKKLDESLAKEREKEAGAAKKRAEQDAALAAYSTPNSLDRFSLSSGAALKGYRDRGGLGVSGLLPTLTSNFRGLYDTPADPNAITGMEGYAAAMPKLKTVAELDKTVGDSVGLSTLEDKIKTVDEMHKREAERAQELAGAILELGDAMQGVMQTFADGGDALKAMMGLGRGISSQVGAYAREKGDSKLATGVVAFDVALGMLQYGQEAEAGEGDMRRAGNAGRMGLNRSKLREAYYRSESSRSYNVFDLGDLWTGLTRGGNLVAGEADDMKRARERADGKLAEYDAKTRTQLMSSLDKGPEGQRTMALMQLDQWADDMRDSLSPEVLREYTDAKRHEIDATYEAAKAAQELGKSASAFNAVMGTADLREGLGLGKRNAGDVSRALQNAGIYVDANALGQDGTQATVVSALESLMLASSMGGGAFDPTKTAMRTSVTAPAASAFSALQGLGIDTSGKSVDQVIALLQQLIVPAMQSMEEVAKQTQNVGKMSDDPTSIKLAAPEVSTLTINQSNVFQVGGSFIGDRASFIAFAREVGIELALQGSQTA